MGITDETWLRWLALLEEMLREADVHHEHKLGIHLDAAIVELHARLGTERRALGDKNQAN